IANLYLRWWEPEEAGQNLQPGMPEYTGRHFDGFGNRVTCWAAANPDKQGTNGRWLTTRAAGFGVIRFNTESRNITFECWPRNVDITDPDSKQYAGWPKTVTQMDNYGRKAQGYLPTLHIEGRNNPVVQVIHERSKEVVYTIRIKGNTFRPKVFDQGTYTIKVGEGEHLKVLQGLKPIGKDDEKSLTVELR
ncbi:MAG: hypothetical protein OES84_06500, partial [Kiritimatiellaceae bacterium]|nr:hypothetical protein [Kiritimatiellaceae bacterium]